MPSSLLTSLKVSNAPSSLSTDFERVRAHRLTHDLKLFISEAWEQVEPIAPYIPGWHIDAICEHLSALKSGAIDKLIINVPPGHMKSLTCAVFWLSWWWTSEPWIRALHASYAAELSLRDSRKTTALINSAWYQARWGATVQLTKKTEHRIENTAGGLRMASSVGGTGTGERAHVIVNDDLLRANDAHSEPARAAAVAHLKAMSTRGVVGFRFRQLIIMQRLHEDDPTGYILKQDLGFEHLCLPAEFESNRRCKTSIFTDPRKTDGEPLWPSVFPASSLAASRKALGTYDYAGQFQQRPAPAEGGIFKRPWWQFVTQAALPVKFNRIVQSWDTAFKTKRENDNSVCTTWGMTDTGYYLLDVWAGKLEFPDLKRQSVALWQKWKPQTVLIEDAASGQSLIQEIRRETSMPLRAVKVDKDKVARAYAVTPIIEAQRVFLVSDAPWLADFLDELSVFPNGTNDDRVDSLTQALDHLIHNPTTGLLDYYAELHAQRMAGLQQQALTA